MSLSRSGFLKQLLGSALDYAPLVLPGVPQLKSSPPSKSPWLPIGPLSEFLPGSQSLVNQNQQIIISQPWGIYALDRATYSAGETEPRRPLRLELNGQISLNPQGTWPGKACLSVLTGNRIMEEEL